MWDLFVFKANCRGSVIVNEVWEVVIGQERCTVQSQTQQTQTGQM